jgi:hypothetical protein
VQEFDARVSEAKRYEDERERERQQQQINQQVVLV